MTESTILVLGAGATLGGRFEVIMDGHCFQPPLDQNFFETPAVQVLFTRECYPALSNYRRSSSLETVWSEVDLYNKLSHRGVISEEQTYLTLESAMHRKASADPSYRAKMEREDRRWCAPDMAVWELRQLVRSVFIEPRHRNSKDSPLDTLLSRLSDEHLARAVVTFNYDTSLERLALLAQHPASYGFYYPGLTSGRIGDRLPLFKLHGSLNWQTDVRSNPRIRELPSTHVADMEHGDGWYRQPEIVGPTLFKQEITLDIEVKDDFRAPFYKELWANAWNTLRTATNLVFVGFSFPQTDFHARALFRSAHLSGTGFKRVILCHKGDSKLRQTAEEVFAGKEVQFTEFPRGLEDMINRLDEVVALLER